MVHTKFIRWSIYLLLAPILLISCSEEEDSTTNGEDTDEASSTYVINMSDFIKIGAEFYMGNYEVTANDTFVIQAPGKDQNWDYTALPDSIGERDTTKIMDPVRFGSSSLMNQADKAIIDDGDTIFIKNESDRINMIGQHVEGRIIALDDPLTWAKFPMSYGNMFTDSASMTTEDTIKGTPAQINVTFHLEAEVDGVGQVMLPSSQTYKCLRSNRTMINHTLTKLDTDENGTYETTAYQNRDTTYSYTFINKDIGYNVLTLTVDRNDQIQSINYRIE